MKEVNGKEYYSLYEYLGHAAGAALGDEINKIAIKQKQKFVQQKVSNSVYEGMVFCYTKEFLSEYFNFKELEKSFTPDTDENDDLPF